LERFGDDRDEIYNELVDGFMENWRRKNLLVIETTNSDIEVDTPPDPIEELREIILNMQYAHAKQFEAMNEQLMAIEEMKSKSWELTLQELILNIRTPMNLSLTVKKIRKFMGKFQ
jgi:hypothetical protein